MTEGMGNMGICLKPACMACVPCLLLSPTVGRNKPAILEPVNLTPPRLGVCLPFIKMTIISTSGSFIPVNTGYYGTFVYHF